MVNNPLAPPKDRELLLRYMDHFGVRPGQSALDRLEAVVQAYTRIPYENLTKIIKRAEHGRSEKARRGPAELLANYFALRTGGTCFSLTSALLYLVRSLGFEAEPLLADRSYGENTHSALVVWIENRAHLLDPGYLIVRPIPLDAQSERRVQTGFNDLVLVSENGRDRLQLHTIQDGRRLYRLTYKTAPADAGEFLRCWDSSFESDLMTYPLLTCTRDTAQLYIRGPHFQLRRRDGVDRREIRREEWAARIAAEFGIAPDIIRNALEILERQGHIHG